MSETFCRTRPIRGVKQRLLAAVSMSSLPLTTGQLAERVGQPSGRVAARMAELEDEGLVVRVNDAERGRGSIAQWRIFTL